MTAEYLACLIAGAVAGGFVNGLAGFGMGMFALAWWLQVMAPTDAVGLVLVMSVLSGLQGLARVRRAIEAKLLARFALPALLGIPAGFWLLRWIDAGLLKLLVAALMLGFAIFFLARRALPALERPTPVLDGLVGFLGGVLGAAAGLSGPLPTMWLSLRAWAKEKIRGVLQPFNVVVLSIGALLLLFDGAYGARSLPALAVAVPVGLVATRLGLLGFSRLSDARFRRLMTLILLASGMSTLATALYPLG